MKHCITAILVSTFLLCGLTTSAQKTHNDYKKELRSLDGSKYISTGFAGARELAGKGRYAESLDLLERVVKKSKSMGNSTRAVILSNKGELIASLFPKEDKYVEELMTAYDEMLQRDPPPSLIEGALASYESIRLRVSDPTKVKVDSRLDQLYGLVNREQQKLVEEAKKEELKEFKKLNKEEAFEELEKLKSERERLEDLQEKLANAVDRSEEQLARRSQIISSMTQDQAKKEAILQYNNRIIDSLRFAAEIDSINLINRERQIKSQESQLDLQQSKLELQESTLQLQESELSLKTSRQRLFLALSLLGMVIAGFLAWLFYSARKTNKQLSIKNEEIEQEKERSEALLLNILPQFIAQELKENSKVKTRKINQCTVVFTDFINFSQISKQLTPEELIGALDECFRAFDNIISDYNIEKIKTIGDAYMCAGGVPVTNTSHAVDAVNASFEMVKFLEEWNDKREKEGKVRFDARIGIHSGPIIAGVVGVKKFAYDIWGDTVNVAARIEGQSAAQRINISDSTYQLIKDHYQCIKRGSISVKNMTDLEMYYVDEPINKAILN